MEVRGELVIGGLSWLFIFGLFCAFGRVLWNMNKEIQSRVNTERSSPNSGDEKIISLTFSDEVIPEKKFWTVRGLLDTLLIFLLMIFIVFSLAIGYSR